MDNELRLTVVLRVPNDYEIEDATMIARFLFIKIGQGIEELDTKEEFEVDFVNAITQFTE